MADRTLVFDCATAIDFLFDHTEVAVVNPQLHHDCLNLSKIVYLHLSLDAPQQQQRNSMTSSETPSIDGLLDSSLGMLQQGILNLSTITDPCSAISSSRPNLLLEVAQALHQLAACAVSEDEATQNIASQAHNNNDRPANTSSSSRNPHSSLQLHHTTSSSRRSTFRSSRRSVSFKESPDGSYAAATVETRHVASERTSGTPASCVGAEAAAAAGHTLSVPYSAEQLPIPELLAQLLPSEAAGAMSQAWASKTAVVLEIDLVMPDDTVAAVSSTVAARTSGASTVASSASWVVCEQSADEQQSSVPAPPASSAGAMFARTPSGALLRRTGSGHMVVPLSASGKEVWTEVSHWSTHTIMKNVGFSDVTAL